MEKREGNGLDEVTKPGWRDRFWVIIVVGIIFVTVISWFLGNFIAKKFLAGNKDKGAVTEDVGRNISAMEKTGEMVVGMKKERRRHDFRETKNTGLTEEEMSSGAAKEEEKAGPTTTEVQVERIEEDDDLIEEQPEVVEKEPPVHEEIKKPEKSIKPEKTVKPEKPASSIEKVEKKPETVAKPVEPQKATETRKQPADDKKQSAAKQEPQAKETEKAGDVVYVLQLGNFTSQENANRMKEILVSQYNLEVYIKKVDYDGETRFRVQAGAFRDKANAQKLARELQIKGYNSYIAEAPAGK